MDKIEKKEQIIEVLAAAIEAIDAQRHEEAKTILAALAQELGQIVEAKEDEHERMEAANEQLRSQLMGAEEV